MMIILLGEGAAQVRTKADGRFYLSFDRLF